MYSYPHSPSLSSLNFVWIYESWVQHYRKSLRPNFRTSAHIRDCTIGTILVEVKRSKMRGSVDGLIWVLMVLRLKLKICRFADCIFGACRISGKKLQKIFAAVMCVHRFCNFFAECRCRFAGVDAPTSGACIFNFQ